MTPYIIEKLIKHRRGMLLLRQILSHTDRSIVADVEITSDATFLQGDHVPAWVGMEYAAQAVGALSGLQALDSGRAVKVGFLLSCRRHKAMLSKFMLGDVITVKAEEEFNDGRMGAYRCALYKGDLEIATLTLSAYIPDSLDDMYTEIG